MPRFLRRVWTRHSKLGRKRKKKQVWRRPTGRDNKMREKRRGYPATVSIGYGTDKSERGKIEGKKPVIIKNVKDLNKMEKGSIALIGKIGKKKKIEVLKVAKEKKIEIYNINVKKFSRMNLKGENKK